MDGNKPNRGRLLELWNKLIPNQGYSAEEIKKISQDHDLGQWTGGNMLTHGVEHKYIFLDDSTNLYYRSDSNLNLAKVTNSNLQTVETVEPINTQIIKEELSKNWEQQKKAKDKYQTILKRKQELSQELIELEKDEKTLAEEIVEFEQKIVLLIQRL